MKVYGVTVISSEGNCVTRQKDGRNVYGESATEIFPGNEKAAVDYAVKTMASNFDACGFEKGEDYNGQTKENLENALRAGENVTIQLSDEHISIEMFEKELKISQIEVEDMVNLSFEAECARQGCEAVQMIANFNKKELEKEIEVWLSIYMEFNDYNRNHAELAFISNHLNIINDYQTMHAENLNFLKEIAAHVNDAAPFPKLREISSEFNSYLDELSVDKKKRKFNTEGDLILKKRQWNMSESFPEPKVAVQDFFELNVDKKKK